MWLWIVVSLHLFFNPEGMTCKLVSIQDSDLVIRFCKDVESRSQTVVHNTMISCTLSLRLSVFVKFVFYCFSWLYQRAHMYIRHFVFLHVVILYIIILISFKAAQPEFGAELPHGTTMSFFSVGNWTFSFLCKAGLCWFWSIWQV